MTTTVKKMRFVHPNSLNAKSCDRNAAGDMRRIQPQTPRSQIMLISSEDFLWMMRRIRGILKNGIRKAATAPRCIRNFIDPFKPQVVLGT
jgi:hypothetical protein